MNKREELLGPNLMGSQPANLAKSRDSRKEAKKVIRAQKLMGKLPLKLNPK